MNTILKLAIFSLLAHISLQLDLLLKLLDLLAKDALALSSLKLILLWNYFTKFALLMSTSLLDLLSEFSDFVRELVSLIC